VVLSVETAYPWDGTVRVEVVESPDREWTLALRIPGWAREATLDGEAVAAGGYAEVRRRWRDGAQVVLLLDVSPRLTVPNPRIDAVRGCLAIERGPVVYCLEQLDLARGLDLADIAADPAADPVDTGPIPQLGGLPGVALTGVVRDLDGWRQSEYRDLRALTAATAASPTRLLAVPYFAWANRSGGAMRVWIPAAQ
jgi:hypothetical protein